MGETSDHIREDIEQTRGRMGETVEAIGYKTDVKSRVKDNFAEKKDAVVSRVTGAMPDGEQVKRGAQKVGVSKQNPLGLAIAAAAVGFVVGTLLPSTDDGGRAPRRDVRPGRREGPRGRPGGARARQGRRARGRRQRQGDGRRADGIQAEAMASSLRDKAQEVGSTSS